MAEWLYEEGIGESRAILVQHGRILEAVIELPGSLRPGAILPARLTKILVPGRRGLAVLAGEEALIEPLPAKVTEGAAIFIEILREPVPEPGRPKLAKARITDMAPRQALTLRQRLGNPPSQPRHGTDRFEEAGWSELLDEAATGEIAFPGGNLRMSLTPAMTLFDVDGSFPPAELARAGAASAAQAIRRLSIGGSIGIDLPTLNGKDERQAAAAAFDASLPQPFERTAVNGFGFLQIVRRRERASIAELMQFDRAAAAARALLRRAERSGGHGERVLTAAPPVVAEMEANPEWLVELTRRLGVPVRLQADSRLSISTGNVHASFA